MLVESVSIRHVGRIRHSEELRMEGLGVIYTGWSRRSPGLIEVNRARVVVVEWWRPWLGGLNTARHSVYTSSCGGYSCGGSSSNSIGRMRLLLLLLMMMLLLLLLLVMMNKMMMTDTTAATTTRTNANAVMEIVVVVVVIDIVATATTNWLRKVVLWLLL